MDFINYIIKNIHEDIIFNISNDKIITIDQNIFIEKYNKYNYKKVSIQEGNYIKSKEKIIKKYKRIQAALIIQKYYRIFRNCV